MPGTLAFAMFWVRTGRRIGSYVRYDIAGESLSSDIVGRSQADTRSQTELGSLRAYTQLKHHPSCNDVATTSRPMTVLRVTAAS